MKKRVQMLICGLAVLAVACKEEPQADELFRFAPAEVGAVGATTADVSCRAEFRLDDYPALEKGFLYGRADDPVGSYRTVAVAESDRNAISARLGGLDPETGYRVYAYAKLGTSRILSDGVALTTLAGEGGGDGGGGAAGPTKYAGWPELLAEQEAGGDYRYAYHLCPDLEIRGNKARNYTVCFSAEHHCPVWVAAPRHLCYEGSVKRTDAYKADPDIPAEIQYRSKSTGGGCNKGHMLGSAERTASKEVNRQVFYYSNIAPQYSSGFNTGKGGWNILEDWIDTQVCTDTTYLVIGTYFDRYEDRYGNTALPKKITFGDRDDISCPTMFYIAVLRTKSGATGKSVRECSADELKCAAFVRCHSNALKGVAVSEKDMISIAELERLTGFTYFPNVPHAPKTRRNPAEWGL